MKISQDQFQRHAQAKLWTRSQAEFLQDGAMFGSGAFDSLTGNSKGTTEIPSV